MRIVVDNDLNPEPVTSASPFAFGRRPIRCPARHHEEAHHGGLLGQRDAPLARGLAAPPP
jgi:hypothetical protein